MECGITLLNKQVMDLLKDKIPKEDEGDRYEEDEETDRKPKKPTFFILTYDVASENASGKSAESGEKLRLRQSLFYRIMSNHLRIQNSVYVVNSKKLIKTIEEIEKLYSKRPDWIRLSVAGEMYKESLEPLLKDYIDTEQKKAKGELEKCEIDLKKTSTETDKLKQKLYRVSKTLNVIKDRVEDLNELIGAKNTLYETNCEKLGNYCGNLLHKVNM